jgi:hypothetical protein
MSDKIKILQHFNTTTSFGSGSVKIQSVTDASSVVFVDREQINRGDPLVVDATRRLDPTFNLQSIRSWSVQPNQDGLERAERALARLAVRSEQTAEVWAANLAQSLAKFRD